MLSAKDLVRERLRRAGVLQSTEPLSQLFDTQLAVVRDPSKRKTMLCGGRAGKTGTALRMMVHDARTVPNSQQLYTAQTRTTAKNILWEPLRELNLRHKWGLDLNESELRARHPNGSWILLAGMDSRPELEKARGIPWWRVVIDECGSHRPSYLQYYVEEVVEPRLMDRDGELWLAGTPTPQAWGYFYDATTTARGWSRHHWTAKQNPNVDFDRFTQELFERRGWTADNPIYRREFLAEWVTESTQRAYAFDPAENVVDALPELSSREEWLRVLSIDYGMDHKTAFAVIAFTERDGVPAFVEKSWSFRGLPPSTIADHTKQAIDDYNPVISVGDLGGMGKAFQGELYKRYGITLKMADKRGKRSNIEITSDALGTRRLKSLRCNKELHRQWMSLQLNEERTDIAKGQEDDEAHAVQYGFAETPAFQDAKRLPATQPLPQHVLEDEDDYEPPERGYMEDYRDE